MPDGTKPLPAPMLTSHQRDLLALIGFQIHRKCSRYLSLIGFWRLLIWDQSRTFQGQLQWRHDGIDGISNHQPHHCLLSRLFGRRSKETSKLRVTGLCVGKSPVTGEFLAQMASNAENVSIWWRHHDQWVKSKPWVSNPHYEASRRWWIPSCHAIFSPLVRHLSRKQTSIVISITSPLTQKCRDFDIFVTGPEVFNLTTSGTAIFRQYVTVSLQCKRIAVLL